LKCTQVHNYIPILSWLFHGLTLYLPWNHAPYRQSLSSLTSSQVADASVSLNVLFGITLVERLSLEKHVCSMSYFHIRISVISALPKILKVASPLPVVLLVPRFTMPINVYLAASATMFTDYKIALPVLLLCYCVALVTCLPSLAAYPSANHVQACRPSLPQPA